MLEAIDEEEGRAGAGVEPISKQMLANARRAVLDVHVSPPVRDYIVRLVSGTRNDPEPITSVGEHLSHPISPRGSISLARAGQARAWLEGRDHVLPDDVSALAGDVLRHRMGLNYRAEADGVRPAHIVATLLDRISVV